MHNSLMIILTLFIWIGFAIVLGKNHDLYDEIDQLSGRTEVIRFLFKNYENLKMDATEVSEHVYCYVGIDDLKNYFKNDDRDYCGKDFLEEYVNKFDHFAKNQISKNLRKEYSLNELAKKMEDELLYFEAKNLVPVNFEKQKEKMMNIHRKIKKIEKTLKMKENINDEMGKSKKKEKQEDLGFLKFDAVVLKDKIGDILSRTLENVEYKFEEPYKMLKYRAIEKIGLSNRQAQFFTLMELDLAMLDQYRAFVKSDAKKEIIVPQLEEIIKELNKLRGEVAEKLKNNYLENISEFTEKNAEIRQVFPGIFEEFTAEIGELIREQIEENQLKDEKTGREKHPKDIKSHEEYEKFKKSYIHILNSIYFYDFLETMVNEMEKMGELLEEIQEEVKGVGNIEYSFKVLKRMEKIVEEEEQQNGKPIDE